MSKELLESMLNKTREKELEDYKKQRFAKLVGSIIGRIASFAVDAGFCWLVLKFVVGVEISFLATAGWGLVLAVASYRFISRQ